MDTCQVCTQTVHVNVTLSIDETVVARAREIARTRGTSLHQIIRDHLEHLTAASTPSLALAELEGLWESQSDERETEVWNREDLYDRPVLR